MGANREPRFSPAIQQLVTFQANHPNVAFIDPVANLQKVSPSIPGKWLCEHAAHHPQHAAWWLLQVLDRGVLLGILQRLSTVGGLGLLRPPAHVMVCSLDTYHVQIETFAATCIFQQVCCTILGSLDAASELQRSCVGDSDIRLGRHWPTHGSSRHEPARNCKAICGMRRQRGTHDDHRAATGGV